MLVIGAGSSHEAPTNLPLASDSAREAHRRLVADGVLAEGACADPSDLSALAETVYDVTGGQTELVVRLRDQLQSPKPNEGHLLAAALLREHSISTVLTLNFDLSMSHALAELGAGVEVAVVAGPEHQGDLGTSTLVYLHRNTEASPEHWILRASVIKEAWRNSWEEIVARRVLASPVTVFAGLGSPAAVLVETVQRIYAALGKSAGNTYQVDVLAREQSEFANQLSLPASDYMQMGWCTFMRQLADRVVQEHRGELEAACLRIRADEGWEPAEDAVGSALCARLADGGLLSLGALRARWTLHDAPYLTRHQVQPDLLADLLLAIGLIEQATGARAVFYDNGVVEFRIGDGILGAIVVASGRGFRRWASLEADLERARPRWARHNPSPQAALVAGLGAARPTAVAPPRDVVADDDPDSIVTGRRSFHMVTADELRSIPTLAARLFA